MDHQQWSVPGAPVSGYVWKAGNPRGAVLLSHGVGEYATRYVERYHALIPTLTEAGFTVYAYDQRGHGRSEGRRAVVDLNVLVEDHLKARQALRERPGGDGLPLFAFGHSMGGLVTAASASRDPRGLSGVILSSPALLVGQEEPALVKALAPLLAKVAPAAPVSDLGTGGLSRLTDEVAAYEADELIYHGKVRALTAASMLGLSGRLWAEYATWTLPTLIIHGAADKITDPSGSQRFFDMIASPDKTLILQEGGYHELLNDEPREEIRAALLAWLLERS
ncbi:alpha/beta hydrolase [Deinococcus radiopugnans]|uniref:Alpha-beta hydrolase superfamily lysophospholipase n=1 Tax=Deinococcus radiopugnans ATCC 19172 TaxID=585398 RepID=A0A5C4Y8E1_9DEIO|nr:alpha/beta hydrolase [Deinococcus radiopugnans]MBB6014828.1 alpha-beta hydrolase superfamily lysophospholipase [Deinococcus radiopugnans ATCC 19172]TNM71746.1 alpha/beta hydrolase [Deinococcus radiopugnans ATCC 19172]